MHQMDFLKKLTEKHITKRQFVLAFFGVVAVLAVIKPFVVQGEERDKVTTGVQHADVQHADAQETMENVHQTTETLSSLDAENSNSVRNLAEGTEKHRILSVPNYKEAFPDSQSVQIMAAERWGVKPVRNRQDAEQRKQELVYVGESPYFHVDRLNSSIPYLVPRAALLLQDIGQAFYDSLYVKGVPFNQLIVTSLLRSQDDVAKLQRHNQNATERSCHLFGTTFDICYNRYQPVTQPVRDDTLKWVLSEVLRDKRVEGRCYIKYEVKQGCFHMTVR